MQPAKIDIAFSINKKYVKYCKVLISSILSYSKSLVVFHVLGNGLDDDDKQVLSENSIQKEFRIKFYDPQFKREDFVIRKNDYIGVETYFRFFLPVLLKDVHSVLYMDVDIVCLDDLTPLFKLDLSNFSCAMCPDLTFSDVRNFNRLGYSMSKGYYNAGVMLINLDYWRKNSVSEKLISYVKNNPSRCLKHDQDAINAVLNGRIFELPTKYNFQHRFFNIYGLEKRYESDLQEYSRFQEPLVDINKWDEIKNSMNDLVLVHFCAQRKPWHKECSVPFAMIWREFYKSDFGKIKLVSCYSTAKRIKILMHNFFAVFGIMKKIEQEVYDEIGYILEAQIKNSVKTICVDLTNNGVCDDNIVVMTGGGGINI